jgi:hypothetical protein
VDRGELTKSAQASSTTSTWVLPGSLEGPADDLHRIRCGTVDSSLYGWIDYSPAEHIAAGHWGTTTGADGGVLFRRSCSLSVIHTYLHLHLRLQLVFTTSIATSEDGVIIVPYVASPVALLTSFFDLLSHCITVPALSESSLTAPRQIATSLSISHYTPPLLPTPKARTDDQRRTDRDPAKALSDQVKSFLFSASSSSPDTYSHICQQSPAIFASFPSPTLPEFPHRG